MIIYYLIFYKYENIQQEAQNQVEDVIARTALSMEGPATDPRGQSLRLGYLKKWIFIRLV